MLNRGTPVLVVENDLRRAAVIAGALSGSPRAHPILWVFECHEALAALARGFEPRIVLLGDPLACERGVALMSRLRRDPRLSRASLLVASGTRPTGIPAVRERWIVEGGGGDLALAIRRTIARTIAHAGPRQPPQRPWRAQIVARSA